MQQLRPAPDRRPLLWVRTLKAIRRLPSEAMDRTLKVICQNPLEYMHLTPKAIAANLREIHRMLKDMTRHQVAMDPIAKEKIHLQLI